jgi:hypothetical protein
LNEKADYLSKIIDYDDWEIKPQLFRLLEGKFGRHTVACEQALSVKESLQGSL